MVQSLICLLIFLSLICKHCLQLNVCNLRASYIITYSHNNLTTCLICCRSPLRPGALQCSRVHYFGEKGSRHLGILFPWRKKSEKNLPWPFTSDHPNWTASSLSPTECSWILELSRSQNGTDVRSPDPDHENEWAHPGDSLNVYGKLEALWTWCTRYHFHMKGWPAYSNILPPATAGVEEYQNVTAVQWWGFVSWV